MQTRIPAPAPAVAPAPAAKPPTRATHVDAAPRVSHAFGRVGVFAPGAALRPKLKVGAPDDAFEREADVAAERVMRMPRPDAAAEVAPRGDSGVLRRTTHDPVEMEEGEVFEAEGGEEGPVRRTAAPGTPGGGGTGAAAAVAAARGGGAPLPEGVRAFMEPRFGHDFSRVRVHADGAAARAAEAVGARAYALGRDVVFGAGEYRPGTEGGMRLLAHELAHVAQAGEAPRRAGAAPALEPGADPETVRRVRWSPSPRTARRSRPWPSLAYLGWVHQVATDAGTPIPAWRPDDNATYWCHGYTFGGSTAPGGPFSLWGSEVPTVLADDGWRRVYSCLARAGDILVFYLADGGVAHTGVIRSLSAPGGTVDETASTLESKWGPSALNTSSWQVNVTQYGSYRVFSKQPAQGPCQGFGAHELP